MNTKMTKAELMEELKTAQQRIAELEGVSVQDITERKQAEDGMYLAESRYRALIDNAPDGIALIGTDLKFKYVSPSAGKIFGYDLNADLELSPDALTHPDDLPMVLGMLADLLEHPEGTPTIQYRFLHKDGDWRWIESTFSNLLALPSVEAIVINFRDITERKQTEEALFISEERFRVALKNLPLVVYNQDRDLRYTWITNPHPGFLNVDILGKTDLDLLPLEDAHPLMAIKQQVLDTGIGTRHEVKTTIQGEVLYYDLLVEPLIDSNGRITGITSTALDITERKKSENALRASEENYRKLAETSDSAIAVLDREGRILYANPISLRVWQEPQLVGKTIHELFSKELADGYLAVVRRVIDEQTIDTNELEITIKGRSKWFHATMSPLKNNDGSIDTLLLNAMDVTDQKQTLEKIESLAKFPAENTGPVLRIDLRGKLLYANDASYAYFTEWSLEVGKQAPDVLLNVAAIVLETGRDKTIETIHEDRVITLDFILLQQGGYINVYGKDITEQRQAEKNVRALQEFSQSTIDALSSHLCVLDETGVILSVNAAWRAFADANPPVPFNYAVGENYLALCDNAQGKEAGEAHAVAAGLRAVLSGEAGGYHLEYPCHSPEEQRWFYLRAQRFESHGVPRLVVSHENITERKRAEIALAEAQRVAKLGNWHYDVASNTITWSDELYRIFDVEKTKFGGFYESFLSHVHPDDRERVVAVNQYAQTNGESFNVEYRIVTRGAVVVYIREAGYALRDSTGQVTGLFGIAQDVTEQVEAAARISESEKRFQQIAETIPEMFWMFDNARQNLTYVSPAYETIWGRPVQELYENNDVYLEAIVPEDRNIVFAALQQQAKGEESEMEYRLVQPNGSIRWIHDRSFPVFDETSGALVRTIGITTDITDRLMSDAAMRESEERLRLSLSAAKQGLYDLNVQTGKAIVNREYAEMLGYDPETFVETNQAWIERLHPDDHDITAKAFYDYTHGLIPEYRVEFRQRTQDGKWKWILSLGKTVEYDADGKPLRMLGTHTDITERKNAELELQKRASQLKLINSVGREITSLLDFQAVMDIFPHLVHEAFGYHHIGLFTLEKNSNQLVMYSKAGEYAGLFPQGHRIPLGEGVVGSVGMSGEMKLANQVYDDPLYIPTLIPTQSELSLPIKVAGEVVGVLDIQSPQPNAFTEEDIKVLDTLVDQMAIVIENIRLYEAVQKELAERKRGEEVRLKLIHDLGERVKEMTVLHRSARLFQNSDISEPEAMQTLVNDLSSGWQHPEITVARITLGSQEYRSARFAETPWMQRVAFSLPNQREGLIEVAYLEERPEEDEGPFLKEESQLIETLAQMLQAALTRQSMEHDLRKRTEDLSNLLEAGRALSETLEPERIYPLVYRYIAEAMPCDFLVLSAFDPQTELITYEYLHSNQGPLDVSEFPPLPLEPPGRGTQSLAIRSGESLLLPDYDQALSTATNHMQFNKKAEILEEDFEDPERTRSAIIVPLKVNGVVAGALQVFSSRLNAHTPVHLHFVEALAFHVSAALSNAKLFSELEERVKQRTAEVQDLYENAPTGYHSLNNEGRFININQTELNWLGYTREEMIGRPFTDFLTPETIPVFIENFPVFKKQGWINNLEFDLLRKDGSSFPVLLNATAIKNEAGDFLTSRSTIFDNTERRNAELALLEREEIYRALFESANDAIFMISPNNIILQTNPHCQDLLGYTADELIGHLSGEFIARSEKDDAENVMVRLLAGEQLPVYERRFVRKNGSLVDTEVNLSLIRDEFGDPKFIQSVVRDISARKQAENALHESDEQNRLLFEESPDAVVLFDPNGRVVRINHAFETITGRHGTQFIGHFVTEIGILPHELINALSATTEAAFEKDEKIAILEFKLEHANGELRDISTRVFTLNMHGEPHYLASMHDVTSSKRAEETLRLANTEMERALRLKDEFLANMSHELRTPLNAVLGITESLLEQVSGPLNEKQQKYLQTVSESAQHLLELINDILDLAKINAGRIDLDINKADIVSAANASLRMVRELAQKKGVTSSLEIDKTVKLAWVDERRLKQMLVNLLSNAVKFTPKDGRIGLEVRGDAPASILHFTVWDTGIGISPKDLHLLFRPFTQLDAGLARDNQGTGLGLVLVSQMARLHGGSVSVESEPGKGSRFTISLPWVVAAGSTNNLVRREHPSTLQAAPVIHTKDGKPIILIVEDTEAVTMLISDYLKQHGYQVIAARDGYEGIARSAETKPDLILMDVMMPELDGLETTRRIRNKPELAAVPIIALTALAMTGDRERCIAAGMNDYLSKPVKLKELLDTIEHNLATRRGEIQ